MKSYLIAGGSRGIGAEVARQLAQPGNALWINHRNSSTAAQELCDGLRYAGAWAQDFRADVTDRHAIRLMVDQIRRQHGTLDAFVYCAASPIVPESILKIEWDSDVLPQIQTACHGFLNCMQEMAALLAPQARVVVLLTDALFHRPPVRMGAYLAAKGALWGLARAAAKEFHRKGVTFAFVSPGMTRTEMLDAYGERGIEILAQDHPLGRLADPAEIAETVVALLEGPVYLHGAHLIVNGGSEF